MFLLKHESFLKQWNICLVQVGYILMFSSSGCGYWRWWKCWGWCLLFSIWAIPLFEKAQGILIPWNGESCYWVWIIGKWNIYISLFLKKYLSDETSWLCWGHTGQIFFSIIWYPQHNLSIRVSYNQPHNGSPWHDLLDLSHLWPCDLLGLRPLIPLLYSPTWQINGSIWNKWPQRGRLSRRFHTSLHA